MLKLLLAALFALIVLTGCNTQRKQVERMQTYAVRYPDQFKILANRLEPCFSGSAKSDTIVKHDTTTIAGNTTIETITRADTVYITKTIQLPSRLITKTLSIHDTIADNRALGSIVSQAKIKSDSLIVVKTNSLRTAKNLNIWRWIALGACALILVYGVIKVYSFFNGGGIAKLIKK